MNRAAIYRRVSCDPQEQDGSFLKTQMARCEPYCRERGYTIVANFSDTFTGDVVTLRGDNIHVAS